MRGGGVTHQHFFPIAITCFGGRRLDPTITEGSFKEHSAALRPFSPMLPAPGRRGATCPPLPPAWKSRCPGPHAPFLSPPRIASTPQPVLEGAQPPGLVGVLGAPHASGLEGGWGGGGWGVVGGVCVWTIHPPPFPSMPAHTSLSFSPME